MILQHLDPTPEQRQRAEELQRSAERLIAHARDAHAFTFYYIADTGQDEKFADLAHAGCTALTEAFATRREAEQALARLATRFPGARGFTRTWYF